jgi:hypothetical protein
MAPRKPHITDEVLRSAAESCGWKPRRVAGLVGMAYGSNLLARLDKIREAAAEDPNPLRIAPPPDPGIPVADLVEHRIRAFRQRQEHEDARRLIPVKVAGSLPIGILFFGDPHIDDDGTDLELLRDHARLVRETRGLYGANVGDTTNNWLGRLARLYGQQGTSAEDAWRLAEWWIREVRDWLFLVGGNHDLWSGAGDPLKWIAAGADAFYQPSEVRVALRFGNGAEVRINCRHDFAGHSQYNPAHGVMKAVQFGSRDHLAVCGHKHVSGYGVLRGPETGIVCHALQIASYKRFDRYAQERGFRDQHLSPCALVVIDPSLPQEHPGLVTVFWDAAQGAEYLGWVRKRAAA